MGNLFNPGAPTQAAPAAVQQVDPEPLVRDAGEVDQTRRTKKRSRSLLDLLLDDDLSPTTL